MTETPNNDISNVQLHLVNDVETAEKFLRWLGERRPENLVSVDIETGELPGRPKNDALSPWKGKIRLAQVGDSMQGWSIPWETWAGVFYQGMIPYTGQVVCHNIAFESKWFALQSEWNFPWHNAHDTMLMAQIIDPLGRADLKGLSSRLIDPRAAALQSSLDEGMVKNGWTWGSVPIDFQPYWAYGALDPVITTRLMLDHFWKYCAPGHVYSIPYELEMQTRKIATKMELNGARIDLDYSKMMLDRLAGYTESVKKWAADRYHGLSIGSNVQLGKQFEAMGAELTERTASGQISMTKDQLKKLTVDFNPEVRYLAETILSQRKADKLASSYFSNFVEDNVDGYVHPSIRTMGARTGRMSITDPALQTLPSKDPTVRRAFLPKDDSYGIVSSDLDQVEFRITASMAEDTALINLFLEADRTNGDVFTDIMRQVYDDPTLTKEDPRRGLIKGVVYGKLYGAGVDKMAITAGVRVEVMRDVVNAFDSNYPGVKKFQKRVEEQGMAHFRNEGQGYVNTKTGRRLPCDEDRVYSLTNYMVQGSAAEIFKQNLVKLDMADLTDYMIVPVHDEIVLQCPLDDAEEFMQTVKECMTTTEGWPIPLTSGVDGPFPNWGVKYEKK